MDRDQTSPEFQRRRKEWAIASRLREVRNFQARIDQSTQPSNAQGVYEAAKVAPGQHLEDLGQREKEKADTESPTTDDTVMMEPDVEDWSFDGPVEDDFLVVNPEKTETTNQPESTWEGYHDAECEINALAEKEWAPWQTQLDQSYDVTKQISYKLAAVICHRGRLSAGHYWVWINDFEDKVWRLYNDASVKVYTDQDEVFKGLNEQGDPYYLCYVRDEDKSDWVSVPKREARTE